MLKFHDLEIPGVQVVDIPINDRWQVYYRLQELQIQCWSPPDGSLKVDIRNDVDAILVCSAVMHITATRQVLVEWLYQCWQP